MTKVTIKKCHDCEGSYRSKGLCFPLCFPLCFGAGYTVIGTNKNKVKETVRQENKTKEIGTQEGI